MEQGLGHQSEETAPDVLWQYSAQHVHSQESIFQMIGRPDMNFQSHEPEKNQDRTGLQPMATGPSVAVHPFIQIWQVREPPQGRLGPVSTGLYTNTTPTRKTQVLHQRHRPSPSPMTTTTTTSIPTPGPATRTGINDDKRADTNSGPALNYDDHQPRPFQVQRRRLQRHRHQRRRQLDSGHDKIYDGRNDLDNTTTTASQLWTGINENNRANTNDYDRRPTTTTIPTSTAATTRTTRRQPQ
ncbi:hypothetical protein EDB85DRAFT_2185207 [Lactarius pseudohatsudake]|nr:hypothetical protein EDB85DRAFT_2185207 [Lactarius pseudohatsudake]